MLSCRASNAMACSITSGRGLEQKLAEAFRHIDHNQNKNVFREEAGRR
jgi:hypothetical protein